MNCWVNPSIIVHNVFGAPDTGLDNQSPCCLFRNLKTELAEPDLAMTTRTRVMDQRAAGSHIFSAMTTRRKVMDQRAAVSHIFSAMTTRRKVMDQRAAGSHIFSAMTTRRTVMDQRAAGSQFFSALTTSALLLFKPHFFHECPFS